MRAIRWFIFAAISGLLFLGLYLACSNTHDITTSPEEPVGPTAPTAKRSADGGIRDIWGLYTVAVYPAQNRVEVVPNRAAWMSINVVPFLHGPGGEMAGLGIEIIDFEDLGITGDCTIGVTLKHPFPTLSEFCGFDVMGLFISDGSGFGVEEAGLRFPVLGNDPVLLNADGYTRWLNPTEFPDDAPWGFYDPLSDENSGFIANATLSAYKYFTEGLDPEDNVEEFFEDPVNCAQRGLFSNGAQCTRNYYIRFPLQGSEPQIFFNYAVLASWAEPIPSPPNHIPEDFPVDANAVFPIYAAVTDYSTLYYVDDDNRGGEIIFDIEIFDWSNFWTPDSLKDKISRVVIESTGDVIYGNHWESDASDLYFKSGSSLISTHLIINIRGRPSDAGFKDLLVILELDPDTGYDQGYGAAVPNAPLALYLRPRIEIVDCPASILTGMSRIKFSSNSDIENVEVFGSGFVDGPYWEFRLENPDTGQEVEGLNITFIDEYTIQTDFNFDDIIPGLFNVICINGCGTEAKIPSLMPFWDGMVRVVAETPMDVAATTGRSGPWAETVDELYLYWPIASHADNYRVYIDTDPYSASGEEGLSDGLELLAETITSGYTHSPASPIPFDNHSSYAYVVRSYAYIGIGNGESQDSNPVFYSGQDFDGSTISGWGYIGQSSNPVLGYIGDTGYSEAGLSFDAPILYLSSPVWLVIHTPQIPNLSHADKAFFEFNHRHQDFLNANGYFVGYTTEGLPEQSHAVVTGVVPIESAAYGGNYNDSASEAIKLEFGYPDEFIENYRKEGSGWWGWYFSGFNVSAALSEDESHIVIGMAFWEYGGTHRFGLDDCALIIY